LRWTQSRQFNTRNNRNMTDLFFNYQLNAQFLYSITIYTLHYNPQRVSSSTMLIFRRLNFIITASGIVTLTLTSKNNKCVTQKILRDEACQPNSNSSVPCDGSIVALEVHCNWSWAGKPHHGESSESHICCS
jgi:hypothetical protein